MGSIVERQLKSGTTVRYAVYRVNGRQKWERVPDEYDGKRGGQRFLAERETAAHPTARTLLRDFAVHWLELKRQVVKRTSWTTYQQGLRLYALPALGHRYLDDIHPREIQQLVTELCQRLSVRYVQQSVVLPLRQIFGQAEQYDLVTRNPAAIRLTYPKERTHRPRRAFTPEQVQRLLQHADEFWRPVFVVCIWTGMRIGEVLAMKWECLDLKNRRYHVEETLTQDRRFTSPKNAASRALIHHCHVRLHLWYIGN